MKIQSESTILITGGAGFLGLHLSECLINGGNEVVFSASPQNDPAQVRLGIEKYINQFKSAPKGLKV